MKKILDYDIDKVHIFKNIKDSTRKEIIKRGKIKVINKKDILFYEKEKIEKIYFLLEGKVSTFKMSEGGERKVIFILKQGEMINEIILDEVKTSTVTCEAFEKSLVLEYSIEEFISIVENDFGLSKNIFNYMERRTRRLYRQLKNSISIKIDKKLAAKLYRISKEFGVKSGSWTLINVNISITYIADMLGCKRETLSRAMKNLQDEGLVKLEGKKIYVKERELSNYFKGN
ncbi:Crp/Fnr family transcriptional regulator [Romboutsia lituseburensis]|uniref:Crp/Fnr family transcriptional regulator n=1 Tax=Romboutsia lituseburensis TaxID=1537 RepID=UPI00215B0AAA|nr:Crp/Fnr family transcriptional regulator [Romboutsia lituseburensis]MCR8747076.1 Crp/Fnr family transcriptional regulator [Romboutsia lituseburensis]